MVKNIFFSKIVPPVEPRFIFGWCALVLRQVFYHFEGSGGYDPLPTGLRAMPQSEELVKQAEEMTLDSTTDAIAREGNELVVTEEHIVNII